MNKASSALVAISVLILLGAWIASRALTADAPAPRAPHAAEPPPAVTPSAASPAPAEKTVAAPAAPTPAPAPPPPPIAPAAPAIETGAPDSDYALENSPAVEEAWKLADGPGPAEWRRAQKLFMRCLTQAPTNERCKSGLVAVEQRLGPRAPQLGAPLRKPPGGPLPKHGSEYVE